MVRVTMADSGQGILAVAEFSDGARMAALLVIQAAMDAGCRAIHVLRVSENPETLAAQGIQPPDGAVIRGADEWEVMP